MNAKICDRCGKFYRKENDTEDCYIISRLAVKKTYKKLTKLDICQNCKKDLERWLENGSKASNFKPDKNNGTV